MTPLQLTGIEPFPLAETPALLPEELYREALAAWPSFAEHHLEPGDPGFDAVASQEPWRSVLGCLNSQELAQYLMGLFGPYLADHWCRLSPDDWRLVDGVHETRHQRYGAPRLESARPAGDLYARTHFQDGVAGYAKRKHVDWPRRMYSCMVYFCDENEIEIEGGETAFYHRDGSLWRVVAPRHNRAVCWLNTRQSWHEGLPVVRSTGPRRWLFHVLSSTQDLWP